MVPVRLFAGDKETRLLVAQTVGFLDIVLVVVYMLMVGYLGWLGYRRTRTTADYLVAGRKVHPFIMAMSYGATFISTSAIVGFGGVAGLFGMSVLWLTVLNIFVGIFVAFVVLGGRTRRMGHRLDAHTFAELLGRRFDSRFVQVIAGLIIFTLMPLYAAAVMIGGTEFLATAFSLDYTVALLVFAAITVMYVFFGGLLGVLYTDALQGSIMVVGMLVLLVSAYAAVGGVYQGHTDLTAMKDQVFVGLKAIGHQGWTSMPKFGWGWGNADPSKGQPSPYDMWWIVVTTIVMGVGIGVLAQPQLAVRFLTVKSRRELNRALAIGGSFILLMTGVAFTVGAISNVYFGKHEKLVGRRIGDLDKVEIIAKKEPGTLKTIPCMLLHLDVDGDMQADAHIVAEGVGPAAGIMPKAEIKDLGDGRIEVAPRSPSFTRAVVFDEQERKWMFNPDSIIPVFVTSAMPWWFRVIFMLTLLSAAMSTMSSQYHTLGTAMGRDVVEQIIGPGRPGANRTIHIVRVGIIIGMLLAVAIGYNARGGYVIARATAIFFGLCASTFLPAFVGGLFFKRITRPAAIASMATGFLSSSFWLLFVKSSEAGAIGLVQKLTGGKSSILGSYPNWPVVDPLVVALPLSILVAVVVSSVTRPMDPGHLEKCFGSQGRLRQD